MSENEIRSKALKLYYQISQNKDLAGLEKLGFIVGEQRGKTMDGDWMIVCNSLHKQYNDLLKAVSWYQNRCKHTTPEADILDIKRKIADLRNVAGCLFLKLQEGFFLVTLKQQILYCHTCDENTSFVKVDTIDGKKLQCENCGKYVVRVK